MRRRRGIDPGIILVFVLLLLLTLGLWTIVHAEPPATSLVAFVQYAYEWGYRGATHQDSVRRIDPVIPLVKSWGAGEHRLDLGVINLADSTITSVAIHVELPDLPDVGAGRAISARPDGHWKAQDARHYAYRIGDLPPGAGRWADGALFLRTGRPGRYTVRYRLIAPSRVPIDGHVVVELRRTP